VLHALLLLLLYTHLQAAAAAADSSDGSTTVCCLAIPADMSVAHFCTFIGAYLSEVRAIQVTATMQLSLALAGTLVAAAALSLGSTAESHSNQCRMYCSTICMRTSSRAQQPVQAMI
jgi:BRCA1-associated protein